MRERFWERIALKDMTRDEWEALCDGCGKCCLNKLEDEDTQEVALTRVACKLFEDNTCLCRHYETRHDHVPECIVLTYDTLPNHMYWLPQTCAYRLMYQGDPLPFWHHLVSGDREAVHNQGQSAQGLTVSEDEIAFEDWEDYIIEEPS
ncbi:MAG: hypothetical protein CSA72_00585 [Rhodobacterales bacterium]|nr:MAG: hypothetical protein CSA72_00585 [Rhodobacterales bacterium]